MDHSEVDRLADAAVEEMPRREDRVALELHRAVAHRLVDDPAAVVAVALENLGGRKAQVSGNAAHGWISTWKALCEVDRVDELITTMLHSDNVSLRQVSPFAGLLTDSERVHSIGRAAR